LNKKLNSIFDFTKTLPKLKQVNVWDANPKKIMFKHSITFALLTLILCSCSKPSEQGPKLSADFKPFKYLSEYGFFHGKLSDLNPSNGVLPYDLNTPLFSDYAEKLRFVWVPEGSAALFVGVGVFEFPLGSVLIKNFYYPLDFRKPEAGRRILETRLLVNTDKGWEALPYIWDETESDAVLDVVGGFKQVSWIDNEGESQILNYSIPNKNQCKGCHEWQGKLLPIGPQAKHLNKSFEYEEGEMNQLEKWKLEGFLASMEQAPELIPALAVWNNSQSGSTEQRARAYLDINCAHCHNPQGPAKNSGLSLLAEEENITALGLNKPPIAAGRGSGNLKFSIVPGKSHESILLYRMESTDPGSMMPELGRKMVHAEGVALIREWIDSMLE
jgi:uncharacterized repeat protein (TIGR03806 family)